MPEPTEAGSPTGQPALLIVEDDPVLQRQLRWAFDQWNVLTAGTREEALALLRRAEPTVVLQDLGLPPDPTGTSEGFATVRAILSLRPRAKVIVMTGNGDRSSALHAIAAGAWDFYEKPVDLDVLKLLVARADRIARLETEHARLLETRGPEPVTGIVAASENMLSLCRKIEKVAPASVSVLLLGESGTGKELVARALHDMSPRARQRFVAISCAAIPENLLEAELFGYERGAFTGAVRTTPGKIENASGGTLFLDEIGDMAPSLQAKLLRFLQERVIERVGGRSEIAVDVRVVSATNRDLVAMTQDGSFRPDLYFRIGEVTLELPPLRERTACIPVVARHFLQRDGAAARPPKRGFTPEAIDALLAHPWPGNVRELESRIRSATIMADGALVSAADLGLASGADGAGVAFNLREVRQRAERGAVRQALAACEGNLSQAAELLGITRPTLYDLLERYDLKPATDASGT